eukprot:TRINITY_DN3068_c0_g1_i1.p1 TRINITY_DN3068_c0_g1~~TRINITY_DN3068_c0_g1_i1.p1  ORF type:complete len:109 (-),score=15.30 TRINITY_DN3068_c0_g1_i1:121-447(-)
MVFVLIVDVHVKQNYISEFTKATKENAENTRHEVGNLRFDVLQSKGDPAHFTLFEVYRSEEDIATHKTTPHYNKWRTTVESYMASPRKGTSYTALSPTTDQDFKTSKL